MPAMVAVRRLGPVVAWFVAVACGWRLAQQSDLLDAVLRGAAVWLGVLVVWLTGVKLCEHVIRPAPDTEGQAAQEAER